MTITPFTKEHETKCLEVIKQHSQSFYLSSLLFPPSIRICAWVIYAFCRTADDAVDDLGGESKPLAIKRVEQLRHRLNKIYSGCPESIYDDAFAHYVQYYKVPKSIPECLLDGLAIDAEGVDFQSEKELIEYSFRVASTVGLMLNYAMGVTSKRALIKGADLGVAMQLTNIARDMGADFRMGRFYLPKSWREEVGFDQSRLDWSEADQPTRELALKLVKLAENHYSSARQGITMLPGRCQLAVTAALYVYSSINNQIRKNKYDTVSTRAIVPVSKKVFLVGRALGRVIVTPPDKSVTSGPSDRIIQNCINALDLPDEDQSLVNLESYVSLEHSG